jgi:hypothetical protein
MTSTPEPDDSAAELVTSFLVAWDELLAAGVHPDSGEVANLPPDLRAKLADGLECVRRLRAAGAAQTPPPGRLPGPTQLGRFAIERELGRGGFGTVYLAHDPELNRPVALKVPRAEALLDPSAGERLRHEARAAALLDHPNIVPVYESGNVGPVWYVASAYCPGVTLAEWVRHRRRSVPWLDVARTMAAAADAVQHAHERGILHRDLKPANILLTADLPADGPETWAGRELRELTPKVADFGLSKVTAGVRDAPTRSGTVLGTPNYMAPEQAEGRVKDVTAATDVYGLGAVLYELLTGRPPFPAGEPLATLRAVSSADPPGPRQIRPDVPRDLELVCLKCLRKEPGGRYPTTAALADDLRRYAGGEPVLARPVGPVERVARWARKRPAAAALAVLVVAIPSALATGASWHNRQLNVALETAEHHKADAEASREAMADAIDDFMLEASVMLQDLPQSEAKQRALLEKAARLCEGLYRDNGTDPAVRQRAVKAYMYVAEIRHRLGDAAGAERAFDQAESAARQLAADFPDVPDARWRLAACLSSRGRVFANVRDAARAGPPLREADALLARLCADAPDELEYRRAWATTLEMLANIERLNPTAPAAAIADQYRAILRLREEVAGKVRGEPEFEYEAARALLGLAGPAEGENKFDEATELLRRAAERLAPLVRAQPDRSSYRKSLAFALTHRGRLLSERLGRRSAGEESLSDGIGNWRRLTADHPLLLDYRVELAKALVALSDAQLANHASDASLKTIGEAVELSDALVQSAPKSDYFLRLQARCLRSLGLIRAGRGELASAMQALTQALDLVEGCLGRQPRDRMLLIMRDEFRIRLGVVAIRRNDPAAARQHLETARKSLQGLPREYAATPEFKGLLGEVEANLAKLDKPHGP